MKNCFYFRYINKIGGIEQFYYYLAKKYNDYDITIIYNDGDYNQIKRLSKLVRCIKYKGQKIKCDKKSMTIEFNSAYIDELGHFQSRIFIKSETIFSFFNIIKRLTLLRFLLRIRVLHREFLLYGFGLFSCFGVLFCHSFISKQRRMIDCCSPWSRRVHTTRVELNKMDRSFHAIMNEYSKYEKSTRNYFCHQ